MKSREQRLFEAKKRQEEIARKTQKMGAARSGNVQTSFARTNKEYLLNMGFYVKGETNKPTPDCFIERSAKKFNKNVTWIDIRKKGE